VWTLVLVAMACHVAAVGLPAQGTQPLGVVVVPMGDAAVDVVQRVSQNLEKRWSIPIDVRAPVSIDRTLVDPDRRQVVAERALVWLEGRFAQQSPSRVIVGVLADDLYSAERSWAYAFSMRKRRRGAPGLAVISTARMREEFYGHQPNKALLAARFGKMLAKNVGVLSLGLPLNDNPTSVMYRNVLSLDDLDRMTDGLDDRPPAK
jgi:predicted Zn-dependent protease